MDIYTLTLDNLQLAYSTMGRSTSPSAIFVHGCMSHREIWRDTMEVLKLSHHCVAFDLLGFGSSPKPRDEDYSIQAQARRVLELADALEIEDFTLVGHSMGAQIAIRIASSLAPERVTRLVCVAGVVTGLLSPWIRRVVYPWVVLGEKLPFLYNLNGRLTRNPLLANFIFSPWFSKAGALPFEYWEIDRQMATQRTIHRSTRASFDAMQGTDMSADLGKIHAPTLAIHGRQDGTVPPSDSQLIKERVDGSQVVWVDDCGHFPMYEKRNKYLDTLLAFLR